MDAIITKRRWLERRPKDPGGIPIDDGSHKGTAKQGKG